MPNFTFRYIISLAIIAPLVIGFYFLNRITYKTQSSDSRIINIAGRQRMLSQKISKVSLEIQNTIDEAERNTYKKELGEAIALWGRSHKGLQEGDEELGLPGKNSEAVKKLFVAIDPAHQKMMETAKSIVRGLDLGQSDINIATFVATMLSNEAVFLSGMDKIVFQYDEEARTRVESLRQINFLLLWIIFLVLIAEGFFILRPAVKRLKQADKLKDEFISTASHQLRTPLTNVQWVAERLLKKEPLSEKGREYAGDIMTSAKNLSLLVDTLLNVSQLNAGEISTRPEFINLVDFIQGLIDEYTPICDKKNLKVSFHYPTEPINAKTDKGAFRNIVQALLSNAIEYTLDEGTIEVVLEEAPQRFVFIVRDNGIGIPKKEQNSFLFQKFHRASNAEKVKPDGSGLGLYIVKQMIELLGGKIWFESEEGKGSAFYVELPLESKEIKGHKLLN